MIQTTHYYQCDSCQSGTVRVESRQFATFSNPCDNIKCGKDFPIVGVDKLKVKMIDQISNDKIVYKLNLFPLKPNKIFR